MVFVFFYSFYKIENYGDSNNTSLKFVRKLV